MVIYNPPGVDTLGNETLLWVPTIADLEEMTVTEATATGAINVSMAVRGFSPGGDQGSSEDIRLGTKTSFENPGRFKPTIDDITYVYDPQADTGDATNKHFETLIGGAVGYLVDIRGLDAQDWAAAADQKYVAYPVTLGEQRPVPIDPSAEGGKFEIVQKPFIRGLPIAGVIVSP
jgi:hypothetical protein